MRVPVSFSAPVVHGLYRAVCGSLRFHEHNRHWLDELNASLDGVKMLTLDMARLAYLSSAGLRVVLAAQKRMNKQGHMTVTHVCADIMEVFEITGFVDILTIV